jgi:hypothetical protein
MRCSLAGFLFREQVMSETIAQMSKAELRDLIERTLEEKLMEMLGDPDEGLEIRESVLARLEGQRRAVVAGARGRSLSDVAAELALE